MRKLQRILEVSGAPSDGGAWVGVFSPLYQHSSTARALLAFPGSQTWSEWGLVSMDAENLTFDWAEETFRPVFRIYAAREIATHLHRIAVPVVRRFVSGFSGTGMDGAAVTDFTRACAANSGIFVL